MASLNEPGTLKLNQEKDNCTGLFQLLIPTLRARIKETKVKIEGAKSARDNLFLKLPISAPTAGKTKIKSM